ncbi:MAG: radical SAM protein [Acutalibacteraceae bacterium]|nr:radical SAM protein [Acutalibacteraceae bacterium]
MKHINVALFVPDMGCPHRCIFCNQKTISGKTIPPTSENVKQAVETALRTADCNEGEIAFFGGSFTAIDRDYMIELLKTAKEYIDRGLFKGIRISTRPDCIDDEVLSVLKHYGVTAIELGCQSMNDEVLVLNKRGHSSECVISAVEKIKKNGFELGVQMMTGLYGDSHSGAIETAKKLISLSPDTVRIYPTVVLENTELEKLFFEGKYVPQSIDEASDLCSELMLMFHEKGIKIIRVGLHSGGNVEEGFVAGVYHPAFREICESKIYLRVILNEIKTKNIKEKNIEIFVGRKFVSQLTGQKKCNIKKLNELGFKVSIVQNDFEKYKVSVRG